MNADTGIAFFLGGFLLGLAWARREESSPDPRSPDPKSPDPKSPGKIEIQWPSSFTPGVKGSSIVVEDPPGGGTFAKPPEHDLEPTDEGTFTIQVSFHRHPKAESTKK